MAKPKRRHSPLLHDSHVAERASSRGTPDRPVLRSSLSATVPKGLNGSSLPVPPDVVESRVAAWVPRPLRTLVPDYRVDLHGMMVVMPNRGITSIRWADVDHSLDLDHEIRTEYEGFKAAPKVLVLHTRQSTQKLRQRIALPKLREPLGVSVHENAWEVGRAALLQLIRHAPGPISISTGVFLDLEINPNNWERARHPKLASRLYVLVALAAGLPLIPWVLQVSHNVGWTVGAFVGYAFAISMIGTMLGCWLLPTYFGPSLVFGAEEGLLGHTPASS